jgi:hypothetical protein
VRLEPENARVLFGLVRQEGMANVRVVLFGATGPGSGAPAMVRRAPRYDQRGYDDDDVTGTVQQRRVERAPAYRPHPWQSPVDPYERSYRAPPPPPYYGPGRPYGWY